jgi:hypothetical protein
MYSHSDYSELAAIIPIILIFVAIAIIPGIFYILTLQKSLTLAGPENRDTEPGMVWLLLIPCFGFIWHFILIGKIRDAIQRWGMKNNVQVGDAGYNVGLWFLILNILSIIPIVGILCSIAGLVLWIMYWVKIAGFNTTMEQNLHMYNQPPQY